MKPHIKSNQILPALLLWLAAISISPAAVRYVDLNSAIPTPPYTNWATAATNIQDAVDAASFGDQILVTNGVYQSGGRVGAGALTNRVVVGNSVAVQSVNGPNFTFIQGYQVPGTTNGDGAIRCVYLSSGASLSGFTLTQGATRNAGDATLERSGGGVFCGSVSAVVSNCVIAGNTASDSGGGAYSGTLNNCVISSNSAGAYGGGASFSTLNSCVLTANSANNGGGVGGNALNFSGTLNNCTLSGNTAANSGGGAIYAVLNNCTLTGNRAVAGGAAFDGKLNNCTLIGNSASEAGGGAYGASYGAMNNCIAYFNTAPFGVNYYNNPMTNCCTTPQPPNGSGNITFDPQLASLSHLSSASPCRGAGSFAAATGIDIDGESWANPPSIGCDEYWTGSVTGALTVAMAVSYTNVAVGFNVNFQTLIAGRVSASRWEFGGGIVVSNRPYASHAWNAAGDYPVVLRAYSESYPSGMAATVTVQVVSQPIHYVALDSPGPLPPYNSWLTAASNIQDAINAATVPGAMVSVSNGVYQVGATVVFGMSNRVAVMKPVKVASVNGSSVTAIVGSGPPGPEAIRCVYLGLGTMLAGFTLTNGATQTSGDFDRQLSGGGVYCAGPSAVVSNCVITGNRANYSAGGAAGGTLESCALTSNSVPNSSAAGGGAAGSWLNNCTLVGNSAGWGGGASGCTLGNCTLTGNRGADSVFFPFPFAGAGGGADRSTLDRCLLTGNSAASGGGAAHSTLRNCTLSSNSATGQFPYNGDFGGGGATASTLINCTLTGNSAPSGGGAAASTLKNCIPYYNNASDGPNFAQGFFGNSSLDYCCTTPMPTNGVGNITNAPLFADTNGWANLRLQTNSPCINSGRNSYALAGTDLDGNPRIAGGTVDIGAYEFQSPASILSYAWAQQYGLPTDGSADFTDSDSDLMNNWQEWIARTIPTDALSALRMFSPTSDASGVTVTWQSVTNQIYLLERATNLQVALPFSLLTSNLVGQASTTSYTDTNAVGPGPFFYRVGVQR